MDGVKTILLILSLLLSAGCGNMMDDFNPSGANKLPPVEPGTTGPAEGQNAPDFTISDSLGAPVTLSSVLSSPTTSGVVLYFTMWCSECIAEMTEIQNSLIPNYFPNVSFFAVDYISKSVAEARTEELSAGFGGPGFVVLADTVQSVTKLYKATMSSTVVIDASGVVRMNEGYKPAKLQSVLGGLP